MSKEKKILPTGAWECKNPGIYKFDVMVASMLTSFFHVNSLSVLDIGCGNGAYVRYFDERGVMAHGVDGNPHTAEIAGPLCSTHDISKFEDTLPVHDWVLCLEVMEHIPKEHEAEAIMNLHNANTKGIILSWAVPGQGGHGHVNEQQNEYVQEIFSKEYEYREAYSEQLRSTATLPWLKNTIMVFERKTV